MRRLLAQWWDNRPSACRERVQQRQKALLAHGVGEYDVDRLAKYNSRRRDGVVHTDSVDAEIVELQSRYNAAIRELARREGSIVLDASD